MQKEFFGEKKREKEEQRKKGWTRSLLVSCTSFVSDTAVV